MYIDQKMNCQQITLLLVPLSTLVDTLVIMTKFNFTKVAFYNLLEVYRYWMIIFKFISDTMLKLENLENESSLMSKTTTSKMFSPQTIYINLLCYSKIDKINGRTKV